MSVASGFAKGLARKTRSLRAAMTGALGRSRPQGSRAYTPIGPDLARVELKSGHSLYIDPQDAIVSHRIVESGHWEVWTTMAVLSLLQPGDHVVEVGANLGYYTVLMADRVGEAGSVLALEANPRLAGMIDQSLVFNGFEARAAVLNRAALDAPGTIRFVTSPTNAGAGHVEILAEAPFADAVTIEVEAVRLDDLDLGRVDFIRMDAEGCEPQILRGAEDVLIRNPHVVICLEWSLIQIHSRTSPGDFLAWMTGLGFGFWRIERDARLEPVMPEAILSLDHTDLIAARGDPRKRPTVRPDA